MKSEHHQMIEEITDEIIRNYVTYRGAFGWTYRENEIKKTLSPLARKIKEQKKVIERYEKALKFYADEEMHEEMLVNEAEYDGDGICINPTQYEPPVIFYDKGDLARKALEA